MNHVFEVITNGFTKIAESHSPKETIDLQLAFLGNTFHAKRVFIFSLLPNGNFSNTYEWCSEGVASEKDVLQNLDNHEWNEKFLLKDEICFDYELLPDLKSLRGMHLRKVDYVQCVAMRYNNMLLGYLGMDSVPSEYRDDGLLGLKYASLILTQSIYAHEIVSRLERIGLKDKLTGLGNRHSLYAYIDQIEKVGSIGVIFADVTGLKRTNDLYGHEAGDRLLVATAKVFSSVFGMDASYRVGGDEFVCVVHDLKKAYFYEKVKQLKICCEHEKIHVAVGEIFEEEWRTDFDLLLKKADLRMYDEKKKYYSHLDQEDGKALESITTLNELVMHVDVDADRYEVLYRNDVELNDIESSGCYSELINKSFKYIHPDDQTKFINLLSLENLEKYIHLDNIYSMLGTYRRHTINGPYKRYLANISVERTEDKKNRVLLLLKNLSNLDNTRFSGSGGAHLEIYQSSFALQRCGLYLAQSNAKKIFVMSIDINHFRLYNNIYGQSAGDTLLEVIGATISRIIDDKCGVSGYIGGDNFIVTGSADNKTTQDIIDAYEDFARSLGLPMRFIPHAGVVIADNNEMGINELYEKASLAMSTLNDNPFTHIAVYDDSNFKLERDKQAVIIDFEKALASHEITFWLQPKVDTETKEILSCEALVRWKKNERVIMARDFVPLLVENHMISALDLYIWKAVIRWLKKMKEIGKKLVPISMNVAIEDFEMLNVAHVFEVLLKENNIEPKYVQLEMPKGVSMALSKDVRRQFKELNDLGIVILFDDIGSEYSSLSLLKQSDSDILKIEKKMLEGFDSEEEKKMIQDFIQFAKLSDKRIVAEGVETEEQLRLIQQMNLTYAQGYYFYKPISLEEMERILKETVNE